MRNAAFTRKTKETDITLNLELLNAGQPGVFTGSSGVGFFDHMLTALCVHGNMNLSLSLSGDYEVDCHHSIEDLGIVFGTAFRQALGDQPVARYGQAYVPMDECLCRSVIDISGRPYLVFHSEFTNSSIGQLDVCMVEEFFYAFTYSSKITLHLEVLYGKNDHHKVEGLFKAFARSISQAMQPAGSLLSTKGVL